MDTPDYDDPEVERLWCEQQRGNIEENLRSQGRTHGRIGDWPAWHVANYVSIWAIESLVRPEWIGWWAISGDLPKDYISAAEIEPPQHPRKALRAFAAHWLDTVAAWEQGRESEAFLSRVGIGTWSWHPCSGAGLGQLSTGPTTIRFGRTSRPAFLRLLERAKPHP